MLALIVGFSGRHVNLKQQEEMRTRLPKASFLLQQSFAASLTIEPSLAPGNFRSSRDQAKEPFYCHHERSIRGPDAVIQCSEF